MLPGSGTAAPGAGGGLAAGGVETGPENREVNEINVFVAVEISSQAKPGMPEGCDEYVVIIAIDVPVKIGIAGNADHRNGVDRLKIQVAVICY